jgi:hypothetical protein
MKYSLDTLPLSNSFAALSPAFHLRVTPTPFETEPRLIHFNAAAALLGLDPCNGALRNTSSLQTALPRIGRP